VVARLVSDALWRLRWFYCVVSVILVFPFWLMYVASGSNVLEISMPAFSLIAAAMLGPMFAIPTTVLRELRHLPVTNRDLWRTTWVAATVVAAGVLLATKVISALLLAAFGGSLKVSVEAMLLSAVYDFSWAGAVLLLLQLLGYGQPAVFGRAAFRPWLAGLAATGRGVAMLAVFALPVLLSGALPTRVREFTSTTTAALIACLAIAFSALAWTPQRVVLAGERAQARRAAVFPGAAPKVQRRRADRLTGISRVVTPHLVATLALAVGACLALTSYGVIAGSGPWWFVPPTAEVFDRADTGYRGLTYYVLVPCGVVTMMGIWTPWARLLKVLPVSVGQINALLLVTPFATWAVLWLLGLAAFSLAYGAAPTLRLEFAFGMAGIGALAHAALLRFQGSTGTVWVMAAIGGLLPQLLKVGLSDATVAHVVFAVIGATALGIAAFVNHHTLTRSTSTSRAYRRSQPPFGVPATPGIR